MGTNEKNIYISHDITSKEIKLEKMLKEKKREKNKEKNKREWISPMTRKPKRVNKNGKISRNIWVD